MISRRVVLGAGAAAMPGVNVAANVRYVAPHGAGDGSSWSSSASLAELSDLIERVGPGGEIRLAGDRGDYSLTEPLNISVGGNSRGAVNIRGVNSSTGAAMLARLAGNRVQGEQGDEAFVLRRGADNLRFGHLGFRNIGNGCFHVSGPVADLAIEDCEYENVYRFLENTAANQETDASLIRFVVRRCRGSRTERGFSRIRYASRDGVVEDCAARGEANEGGSIPVGCALEDSASNVTYRRCVMENFQQWHAGAYWNGDGFSDESDNRGIRYEACQARGSTDAGFDCKSHDVVLDRCVAEDNKRNFRLWSEQATLTNCVSRNPNFRGAAFENASPCHIWIGGEGARIRAMGLTIEDRDATPIVEFDEDGASAEMGDVTIHSPHANWGNVNLRRTGRTVVATAR